MCEKIGRLQGRSERWHLIFTTGLIPVERIGVLVSRESISFSFISFSNLYYHCTIVWTVTWPVPMSSQYITSHTYMQGQGSEAPSSGHCWKLTEFSEGQLVPTTSFTWFLWVPGWIKKIVVSILWSHRFQEKKDDIWLLDTTIATNPGYYLQSWGLVGMQGHCLHMNSRHFNAP
jgi:hypothetical protein